MNVIEAIMILVFVLLSCPPSVENQFSDFMLCLKLSFSKVGVFQTFLIEIMPWC